MALECEHIRNEFSALLDNELNPEDRELVEEHLSDCSDCLRELHGYKLVSDRYRYHHPVKAPDDFEARFHAAIAPIGKARTWPRPGWTALAAAAGLALVTGLVVWRAQSPLDQMQVASEMAAPPESPMSAGRMESEAVVETMALESAPVAADMARPQTEEDTAAGATLFRAEGAPENFGAGGAAAPAEKRDINAAALSAPAEAPVPDAGTAPAPEAMALSAPATAPPVNLESEGAARMMKSPAAEAPAPILWRERAFNLAEGVLSESTWTGEATTDITIPSEAWNELLDTYPDLVTLCDREEPVVVKLDDIWYRIARQADE